MLVVACVGSPEPPPDDALKVGALLPFTGSLGASGDNVERGLLLAVEAINEAGGIDGRPLQLVARDTHSDVERGLDAARELLDGEDVRGLIGPEDAELATALLPLIVERGVALVSASEASVPTVDDDGLWVQTAPTAATTGRALAGRAYADGALDVAVLTERSAFGEAFTAAFRSELERLGGSVPAQVSFDHGQDSYQAEIEEAVDSAAARRPAGRPAALERRAG